MTKVQMTQEQLDHIQELKEVYPRFEVIMSDGEWNVDRAFLNKMPKIDKATAWIAPNLVEIIQPEMTGREAMNAVFDGEEIQSKHKDATIWWTVDIDADIEDFRNTDFKWRKVVKS